MEWKKFDEWNNLKQRLHGRVWRHYIREGEIWFCSLGVNIGWEQDGKNETFERPVLVVRKLSRHYFWVYR
ncbi:MAG: hypothetical protein NT003_02595 [Candidatus Magasanikbacteria bacterium]|nr:hypothetical protein [Candidatus Magasanikbacteria bacterium]